LENSKVCQLFYELTGRTTN
jgi:hypothetical protein